MPRIKCEITWDEPDDQNWLNIYNIKVCLDAYCPNTHFEVVELDECGHRIKTTRDGVKAKGSVGNPDPNAKGEMKSEIL